MYLNLQKNFYNIKEVCFTNFLALYPTTTMKMIGEIVLNLYLRFCTCFAKQSGSLFVKNVKMIIFKIPVLKIFNFKNLEMNSKIRYFLSLLHLFSI